MSPLDLSYAKKRETDQPVTLALDLRGWTCGWALFVGENPQNCGRLTPRDHNEGKPVPASQRVAGLFMNLIAIGLDSHANMVAVDLKKDQGPLWTVPPLLAVTLRARYAELRGWMEDLGFDNKSLKAWATVVLGKPPQDEAITVALGVGLVSSRLRQANKVGVDLLPPEA